MTWTQTFNSASILRGVTVIVSLGGSALVRVDPSNSVVVCAIKGVRDGAFFKFSNDKVLGELLPRLQGSSRRGLLEALSSNGLQVLVQVHCSTSNLCRPASAGA